MPQTTTVRHAIVAAPVFATRQTAITTKTARPVPFVKPSVVANTPSKAAHPTPIMTGATMPTVMCRQRIHAIRILLMVTSLPLTSATWHKPVLKLPVATAALTAQQLMPPAIRATTSNPIITPQPRESLVPPPVIG